MPRGMRTENKSPGFGREHSDSRPRSLAFTSLVYLRASCVLSPRPDCKLLRVRPVFQMLATQSAPHGWGGGGDGPRRSPRKARLPGRGVRPARGLCCQRPRPTPIRNSIPHPKAVVSIGAILAGSQGRRDSGPHHVCLIYQSDPRRHQLGARGRLRTTASPVKKAALITAAVRCGIRPAEYRATDFMKAFFFYSSQKMKVRNSSHATGHRTVYLYSYASGRTLLPSAWRSRRTPGRVNTPRTAAVTQDSGGSTVIGSRDRVT